MLKLNFRRRNTLQDLLPTDEGKTKAESQIIKVGAETGGDIMSKLMARRDMLYSLGLASAGVAASAMIGASDSSYAQTNIDPAILNFALNLEYLEAEYYLRAIRGNGLSRELRGGNKAGEVIGGSEVPFDPNGLIIQYAREIARDEEDHVRFLRLALGNAAVPRPDINFTDAFNVIGFDPFENELNFLLGAFVFEDVGVTAYNGAAPLITSKEILAAAASIALVEAYHAGNIRTVLFALGQDNPDLITTSTVISNARDSLDRNGDKDQPITKGGGPNGDANIVPTDGFARVFARTVEQVLRIVYLDPNAQPGGFFPNGLNGTFS